MDHLQLSGETNSLSESARFQIAVVSSFRDWAELLPELVDIILQKLHEFSDYVRFCGVCSGWRSLALQNTGSHRQSLDLLKSSRNKLPMLLLQTEENNYNDRSLYSVSDGKTYKLQLPIPCRRRFVGSSHGWLICCEENEVITLLNPLTKVFFSLPKLNGGHANWHPLPHEEYYLGKAILTEDPDVRPNDYAVVVIYGGCCDLAIYRSGDINWKFIDLHKIMVYIDVVCFRDNIYGLTFKGELVLVDPDSGTGELILKEPSDDEPRTLCYLVESQGELLLVWRTLCIKNNLRVKNNMDILSNDDNINEDEEEDEEGNLSNEDPYWTIHTYRSITRDFTVFKLVPEKGNAKLVQVNNIGEQVLFLGGNHSVSISTLEFPECQSNSIYFTNDYYIHRPPYVCGGLDEDSGIFNMKDKSFKLHHRLDMCEWYMNPPIWFIPNLAIKT